MFYHHTKIIFLTLLSFVGIITGLTIPQPSLAAECKVVSATFDPYTGSGKLAQDGWFKEQNTHRVKNNKIHITITTKDCAGKDIYVALEGDLEFVGKVPVFSANVDVLDDKKYTVPTTETFSIDLIAGEESCINDPLDTGSPGIADCQFRLLIDTPGINFDYSSEDNTYGTLHYECDGGCKGGLPWLYAGDTSVVPYPADPAIKETETAMVVAEGGGTVIDVNSPCYDPVAKTMETDCYAIYEGLSGIFEKLGTKLTTVSNAASLGVFLNALIALVIGAAGLITVALIMWDGFTYWNTGRSGKTQDLGAVRGRIWKRLLGLLILFSMYTLLRTINPDLLNLTPRINVIELITESQASLSTSDYTAITGEPLKSPSEYDALAKQVAQTYSSDYCALRVIIQNESRGNPNVVGQDENVRNAGIPSRIAFINSGKKYSGLTFSPASGLVTKKGFCNDASGCAGGVPNPTSNTLGLDWRFSKGIGLAQITFFPNDYDNFKNNGYVPSYANKNNPPSRTFNFSTGAMTVTPAQMFKPEKNLEVAAKLWNEGIQKCGSAQGAFYTYACGQCNCSSNKYAKTEVSERVGQYNQCKQQVP